MGLGDRPYWGEGSDGSQSGGGSTFGGLRLVLPRPGRAVIALMVACGAVAVGGSLTEGLRAAVMHWMPLSPGDGLQVWRLVTYQFVHANPGHLVFNLLGLYFFGPPLEQVWGWRRFTAFYLTCGVAGGACFLGMAAAWSPGASLVGASGSVLGCLAACAILFPQFRVLIFPIRWVAVIFGVLYLLSAAGGSDLGDAAHLGGMIAGALWVWGLPRLRGAGPRAGDSVRQGAWRRRMDRQAQLQAQIDRILEKIHHDGIASLTEKEKKTLQQATREQREGPRGLR